MPLHEQQSKVSLEIDRQYLEDCSNLLLLTAITRGALHHWLALQHSQEDLCPCPAQQVLTSLRCHGRCGRLLVLHGEVAARLGAPDLARSCVIGARSFLRRLKGAQPSALTHARLREVGA